MDIPAKVIDDINKEVFIGGNKMEGEMVNVARGTSVILTGPFHIDQHLEVLSSISHFVHQWITLLISI